MIVRVWCLSGSFPNEESKLRPYEKSAICYNDAIEGLRLILLPMGTNGRTGLSQLDPSQQKKCMTYVEDIATVQKADLRKHFTLESDNVPAPPGVRWKHFKLDPMTFMDTSRDPISVPLSQIHDFVPNVQVAILGHIIRIKRISRPLQYAEHKQQIKEFDATKGITMLSAEQESVGDFLDSLKSFEGSKY